MSKMDWLSWWMLLVGLVIVVNLAGLFVRDWLREPRPSRRLLRL